MKQTVTDNELVALLQQVQSPPPSAGASDNNNRDDSPAYDPPAHEFVVVTDIQISWARAFMLTLQFGLSGCLILFLYRLLWHIIDLMLVAPAAVIMKP